jgi:sugar lactone lactonase YvrE
MGGGRASVAPRVVGIAAALVLGCGGGRGAGGGTGGGAGGAAGAATGGSGSGVGGSGGAAGGSGTGGAAGTGGATGAGGKAGGSGSGGVVGSGGAGGGAGRPGGPAAYTTLSLVAGQADIGRFADDVGTMAYFGRLAGLASDGAGNLFLVDSVYHTLRKVVTGTAVVTTLAGFPDAAGADDGVGGAARFFAPTGVTFDGAGNLYVSEWSNQTIRKVDAATGAVTTLAGAPTPSSVDAVGADARFLYPQDLASDGAGHLFVCDQGNATIRRIDLATRAVTTLAGSSGMRASTDGAGAAARFMAPDGMTSDGAGNLYVADTDAHVVRKIVIATGAVTTLAGYPMGAGSVDGTGATANFRNPRGITSDGAGNLYVADGGNHTIRRVVIATGVVTTLAGSPLLAGGADGMGAAARFNNPWGIASDGAGNLYVNDSDNALLRKVVIATGAVSTLAGHTNPPVSDSADGTGAAARFAGGLLGAAIVLEGEGAGHLFVADRRLVRKVAIASGAVTTFAGGAGPPTAIRDGVGTDALFVTVAGLCADGRGNLFVADVGNHGIRQIALGTAAVTTVAGSIYLGSADGVAGAASFNNPDGITTDRAGNLFVADSVNHAIRKVVVATRTVTTLAGSVEQAGYADGTGAAARFNVPKDIVADGAGNLFVSDVRNAVIRKVVIATGQVTTVAGMPGVYGSADGVGAAARFEFSRGLALDGVGNLFVADFSNHAIRRVVIATGAVTTLVGSRLRGAIKLGSLPGGLMGPVGLALGPSGEIFITDSRAVLVVR